MKKRAVLKIIFIGLPALIAIFLVMIGGSLEKGLMDLKAVAESKLQR